ncbi:MAG: transposase [Ktedonobacteraceae bacterium]
MHDLPKHSQAKLYPSEVVTIGILYAVKGGHFRAFYRWIRRDYSDLFPGLPDRTRLLRLLETHQDWCDKMLADPSFFTVIDSYPIELIFPIREGRSKQQVGKKGKDKGRWTIGIKYCWLLNNHGRVVDWGWAPLDTHDQEFHHIIERYDGKTIVLSDLGFNSAGSLPGNLKLCEKGTWNERMRVETALSMVSVVCGLKHIHHRLSQYIEAHLSWVSAMFNVLLSIFHRIHPDADLAQMSIAEFSM